MTLDDQWLAFASDCFKVWASGRPFSFDGLLYFAVETFASRVVLRRVNQSCSAPLRIGRRDGVLVRTTSPLHDSSVWTSTPCAAAVNSQTLTASMPWAGPVQTILCIGVSSSTVEIIFKPPFSQLKAAPGWSTPSKRAAITVGRHWVQALMSAYTFQTVSNEALMTMSLREIAGAAVSMAATGCACASLTVKPALTASATSAAATALPTTRDLQTGD